MGMLYTIGYGDDPPDVFLKRLKDAGILWIFDIRRSFSNSWCRHYREGVLGMGRWLDDYDINYLIASEVANLCGGLTNYAEWLTGRTAQKHLLSIADDMRHCRGRFCLLCAERDAFKDGEVNCHRFYVADALVKLLGDEWTVEHI